MVLELLYQFRYKSLTTDFCKFACLLNHIPMHLQPKSLILLYTKYVIMHVNINVKSHPLPFGLSHCHRFDTKIVPTVEY